MVPTLQSNGSAIPSTPETPANRLSTLFDRFFHDDVYAPMPAPAAAVAPLAMWEDDERLYVEMDAPGLTEQDIDVSIHNGVLFIRGERKCERQQNGYDTRTYGCFEQRISLPTWAKADRVEARLANGVLALTFPKGEEARPKKVPVKVK